MAEQILTINAFNGGLSQAEKIGLEGSFNWGECLDYTTDPNQMTILPKSTKVSGSTAEALIKWIVDGSPYTTSKFFYDSAGNIYEETSIGTWSKLRAVASSGGQGLAVFNDYLYYTQDTQIGRYGPLSGAAAFTDNWQTGLNDTSTTNYAPIMPFTTGFVVGHGNDLAWYDGTTFTAEQLTLEPGYEIRCLTQVQENVVLGAWRSDGAVTDSEHGLIAFWDGGSVNFNYFFPTNGAPNAICNDKNRLLSIQGSRGQIYTDQEPFNLVNQIKNLGAGEYVEVLPGAITKWQGQTYIGVAGNTDSSTVKQGIYTYGSKSTLFNETLNFAHKVSTGTQTGTTLKIGALLGIGNQLYYSWDDNGTYGVDKISSSSTPAAQAIYRSLVFDNGKPSKDKLSKVLMVTHKALASGESIQLGYKHDRATSWTTDTANSTADTKSTRFAIPPTRFKEIELEIILATSGTTAPTVTGWDFLYDDLEEEKQLV